MTAPEPSRILSMPTGPIALEAAPGAPPRDMPRWVYWVVLVVLTVTGAAMRAMWLDGPMRYDESWTFLFYVMPRTLSAALTYSAPNNHVLHTLLVAVASWLGGDSPLVLRMPAFLAGVVIIPAAGHLATVLAARRLAGVVAAALVAGSGVLIECSANARGYPMVFLAAVLLMERTARIIRNARPVGPWVAWVVIAALGLFTIPIMLYPVIALAVVLALQALLGPAKGAARRLALRRTAAAVSLALFLAGALYLPVIRATGLAITEGDPAARSSPAAVYGSGLYALVGNEFLVPQPLGQVAGKLPAVAADTLSLWARGMSWLWVALAAGGVLAGVVAGVWRRRVLWLLPGVLAVVFVGMTLLQRVVPFARVWLFALPMLLAVAGAGWAELVWCARWGCGGVLAGAILAAAAMATTVQAGWRCAQPARRVSVDACLPDARAIITDALTLADGRTGMAWDYQVPVWPPLEYYAATLSTPQRHLVHYLDDDCRRVLVVVPEGQSLATVLEHRPRLAEAYGPMQPWRSYPGAEVYVAHRKPTASSP